MANDGTGGASGTATLPPPTAPVLTGRPSGDDRSRNERVWTLAGSAAMVLVGLTGYVGGIFGVGRWITGLALVTAAGLHGAFGAAVVVALWPSKPRFWSRQRIVPVAVAVAFEAAVVAGLVAVGSRRLHGPLVRWYWGVAVLSAAAGGALAFQSRRLTFGAGPRRRARVAVAWCVALGTTVAVLATCTTVATLYHHRSTDDQPFALRPVSVVSGPYLAIGDSFAAGDGLGPYLPGTDGITAVGGNDCHRSPFAYANWLTFAQGVTPTVFSACRNADAVDVSQHRVRTADAPRPAATSAPATAVPSPTARLDPQIGAAPYAGVNLITLSIGAEEAGIDQLVVHCVATRRCLTSTFSFDDSSDGSNGATASTAATLEDAATQRIIRLDNTLGPVFKALRSAYPSARIIVVGYPHLFPAGRAPGSLSACSSSLRRIDQTERDGLRKIEQQVDHRLYELAVGAQLEYVSAEATWKGHEVCGDHDGYLTRPSLLWQESTDIVPKGRILPTRRGQQLLARQVACYLTTFRAVPDPYGGSVPNWSKMAGTLVAPEFVGLKAAPGSSASPLNEECLQPEPAKTPGP